jgi:UDP-N-acetylmuramate dehydrogenase
VLREREPLAPRTTFELGGPARYFTEVTGEAQLVEALRWAERERVEVAILGGGSNLVVSDAGFDGLVIKIALRGVELSVQGSTALLTAQAGEPWDEIVAASVERDLAGLECLSGIPGLVGATPIQNVGAYGQEVSDVISSVRVLDRVSLRVQTLEASECGFRYRDSAFKKNPERCVVLAVSFALRVGGEPTLIYAELQRALAARHAAPSLHDVRESVLALRRGKSMVLDPADENRRSAGSFFTNPVVSAAEADRIAARAVEDRVIARAEDMPRYPADGGHIKLAAAWLIERAGIRKGDRRGQIGVSSRHSLALVHHGGGSSAELIEFARKLRERVRDQFGVELVPEPVLLGFEAGFGL